MDFQRLRGKGKCEPDMARNVGFEILVFGDVKHCSGALRHVCIAELVAGGTVYLRESILWM